METGNKLILIFSILFLIVIILFLVSIIGTKDLVGWASVSAGASGSDSCPSGYKCMFVALDGGKETPPSLVAAKDAEYFLVGCGVLLEDRSGWAFCVKK